uniref:Uncharacterized protein n=1 Tax=Arundo donax TaxID=35708 RepID=A0A0A9BTP6_ARUDO
MSGSSFIYHLNSKRTHVCNLII